MNKKKLATIPTILFVVILAAAVFLRFVNITTIGFSGADTFMYYRVATSWSEGDYSVLGDEHLIDEQLDLFRPVPFYIYSQLIRHFGQYDYSIMLFNSVVDIFNIILLFMLGTRLKNAWLGLLSAMTYAFIPAAIEHSRMALFHIMTEFFVLIMVVCLLNLIGCKTKKSFYFNCVSAGLFAALGICTHPAVGFLLPGAIAVIGIAALGQQGVQDRIRRFFYGSLQFVAASLSLLFAGCFFWGFQRIFDAFFKGGMRGVSQNSRSLMDMGIQLVKLIHVNIYFFFSLKIFDLIFFFACISCVILFTRSNILKRNKGTAGTIPFVLMILMFSYFIFTTLFTTEIITRYFIPLLPLFILFIYLTIYETYEEIVLFATARYGRERSIIVFMRKSPIHLIVIFLLFSLFFTSNYSVARTMAYVRGQRPHLYLDFWNVYGRTPSVYREVYNTIGGRVTDKERLLVLPFLFRHEGGFSIKPYFGDNVSYIRNLYLNLEFGCDDNWEDYIKRNRIRYIFFGTAGEMFAPNAEFFLRYSPGQDIPACYGIPSGNFNPSDELAFIIDKVKQAGGKAIYRLDTGIIFDLGQQGASNKIN